GCKSMGMEKSSLHQCGMLGCLPVSGSRNAPGQRERRFVPESWALRSFFLAVIVGGRFDLWKARPGKAADSAIVHSRRKHPPDASHGLSCSSLVYDRTANRPGKTALDSGQVASRTVANHEFFCDDLGHREDTSGITALGNSTSPIQRGRPQHAPSVLQSNLFVSSA